MFSKIVNIIARSSYVGLHFFFQPSVSLVSFECEPCFIRVRALFHSSESLVAFLKVTYRHCLIGTKLHSRTYETALTAVSYVKAEPKLHKVQKFATKLQGIKTNSYNFDCKSKLSQFVFTPPYMPKTKYLTRVRFIELRARVSSLFHSCVSRVSALFQPSVCLVSEYYGLTQR